MLCVATVSQSEICIRPRHESRPGLCDRHYGLTLSWYRLAHPSYVQDTASCYCASRSLGPAGLASRPVAAFCSGSSHNNLTTMIRHTTHVTCTLEKLTHPLGLRS